MTVFELLIVLVWAAFIYISVFEMARLSTFFSAMVAESRLAEGIVFISSDQICEKRSLSAPFDAFDHARARHIQVRLQLA